MFFFQTRYHTPESPPVLLESSFDEKDVAGLADSETYGFQSNIQQYHDALAR